VSFLVDKVDDQAKFIKDIFAYRILKIKERGAFR
jgi:hypothetical protein